MRKLTKERKMMQGTYDRSKEKPVMTMDPLTEIPEPMYPLNEVEAGYFNHCAGIMLQNKTLTASDIPGLTRASSWYGIYTKALEDVAVHGCYTVSSNGYSAKSGYLTVLAQAQSILDSWERSQGLNLVSRSKIPPPPPAQLPDPFANI